MALRIISAALILFTLYMGIKQGWAMLTGQPAMLDLFGKWNFNRTALGALGLVVILGAVLTLFPATFITGNFLTAACILYIIIRHVYDHDWKGAAIEMPFFLLPFFIAYLRHPLTRQ